LEEPEYFMEFKKMRPDSDIKNKPINDMEHFDSEVVQMLDKKFLNK
jgi:hypothetical protein